MKGGRKRKGERKPERTSKRTTKAKVSPEAEEKSNDVPDRSLEANSALHTPKRTRRQKGQIPAGCLTSTPVHSTSLSILPHIPKAPPGAKQSELEYTELCTQLKTSEINAPCSKSNYQIRRRGDNISKHMRLRKRLIKEPACINASGSQPKRRPGRPKKIKAGNLQDITTKSSDRSLPRLKLDESDEAGKEIEESLLSSDLSIELSHHEEQLLTVSVQEEESTEEEDELPSFLIQGDKKPPSITKGAFVWHKFRNHPFWPALVKGVDRKGKKASVLFIDDLAISTKRGITVPLKTLKPLDCEEADELVRIATENYKDCIQWSLDVITDYRIRIALGSFSGSFIEYFAHDMSYPVRRKYPHAASEKLTIVDPTSEVLGDGHEEDSFNEQQEEVTRSTKRLLPDRSHAAYNRANERLVHFIVKQRMVDKRLLAVISGKQQSRWLRSFLNANRRRVVNIYLEDDQQLDQVYRYLYELYSKAVATGPCLDDLKSTESAPFILDVLLPEAIIYAIAGVDKVSVKKAEEKYLIRRCISNREAQEFDLMIERYMQKKMQSQSPPPALSPDITAL